jgi:hypothetical protein
MPADLQLISAIRVGMKLPNGAYKSERHFLDFTIDGQSLWGKIGRSRDSVSVLCRDFVLSETIRAANRLLLFEPADCPDDRRSLFVCAECGDLGCGAVTASIVREDDEIVWKDFGYENNYEQNIVMDEYRSVGPFRFDSAAYEHALFKAIEQLAAKSR